MQSNDEVHLCSSFILHDYEVKRQVNEKKIGTQDLLLVQEKKSRNNVAHVIHVPFI